MIQNTALAMVCRKLVIGIIYRRLLGSYSESLFYLDLHEISLVMERLTGVQAHITFAAWYRLYYYYERNRTAIVNGGIDK